MTTSSDDPERRDLLEVLGKHRDLFRLTVQGLTDEQARERSTVSELTLGGLVKHVAAVERQWAGFIVDGPPSGEIDFASIDWSDPPAWVLERRREFVLQDDETLAGVLAAYAEVSAATDELVATVDLDASHPLPQAPWFEPGASWSNRRVVVHILAETAQHAGHADIVREAIDGQRSMG